MSHKLTADDANDLIYKIHYWQHGRIGRYVVEKPIVLGYESAGIIQECGPDVKT